MFGYILLSKANSTEEERQIYKAYYCGLCHILKKEYGSSGQKSLSYDMVFLEMLLSDLYNSPIIEGEETCTLHPVKKHSFIITDMTEYAADMQMLLHYYSLLDNIKDEDKGSKDAEEIRDKVLVIEEKYPRQAGRVKKELNLIDKYESLGIKDVEMMSNLFGSLLGEIFVIKENDHFADDLRLLGVALGRFIYVLDAWVDLKKDYQKGLYNPLDKDVERDKVKEMLLENAALASQAFERLPLDEYLAIFRNIIYSGIWMKFETRKKD